VGAAGGDGGAALGPGHGRRNRQAGPLPPLRPRRPAAGHRRRPQRLPAPPGPRPSGRGAPRPPPAPPAGAWPGAAAPRPPGGAGEEGRRAAGPLAVPGDLRVLALGPDGRRLVTECRDEEARPPRSDARLWDAGAGEELARLGAGLFRDVLFSPDGETFVTLG